MPKKTASIPGNAPLKITSAHLRRALRGHFAAPSRGIVFEVAQATGFSANRHLDAIGMDLWSSHGLGIHGIEIKVDRADWRRELKDPGKAEEIARFCDYFWVAAPVGIVPVTELPPAWGLLEFTPGKPLSTSKVAAKTQAMPLTRDFMAALMRASGRAFGEDDTSAVLTSRLAEQEAAFETKVREAVDRRRVENDEDAKHWHKLLVALGEVNEKGEPLQWFYDTDGLAEAVKFVRKVGVTKTYGGLAEVLETLLGAGDDLRSKMLEAGLPTEGPKQQRAAKGNQPR